MEYRYEICHMLCTRLKQCSSFLFAVAKGMNDWLRASFMVLLTCSNTYVVAFILNMQSNY